MDVGTRALGLRRLRVAGCPAAWNEDLLRVSGVSIHSADEQEREKLKRIGDDPVVASFALEDATLKVAARREDRSTLAGPFAGSLA